MLVPVPAFTPEGRAGSSAPKHTMTKNTTTTNAAGATQPVYQVVTQWLAADGTQNTGSDERIVSEHDNFAAAQLALAKTEIRHPHNHAEIIAAGSAHA